MLYEAAPYLITCNSPIDPSVQSPGIGGLFHLHFGCIKNRFVSTSCVKCWIFDKQPLSERKTASSSLFLLPTELSVQPKWRGLLCNNGRLALQQPFILPALDLSHHIYGRGRSMKRRHKEVFFSFAYLLGGTERVWPHSPFIMWPCACSLIDLFSVCF